MRMTELPLCEEVAEEYIELRRSGNSRSDAEAEMQERYECELTQGADDDGLLFWIGLADGQYKLKELSSEVSEEAIHALNLVEQTDWGITPGDFSRRRLHYAQAPMPERKLGKPRPKFRCAWKIGDTFAYQLSGPEAESLGISKQYMLLRKVNEIEWRDGQLLPIVSMSLWGDAPLPKNSEEFKKVPMLKLSSGRCESPPGHYEYRAQILFKSNRELANIPLNYLGCFEDIEMPADEYVQTQPGSVLMTSPNNLNHECCIRWKAHLYLTARQTDSQK